MDDFLRWLAVPGLTFASLIVGFFISLMVFSGDDERPSLGTIVVGVAAGFVCAIQLVRDPVIDPLWLQYLILIGLAGVVGAAIPPALSMRNRDDAPRS